MTDDGWWVLPLGHKKLRTDPPDYPVILRQPSWSLLSTFISAEVVAAIRVAQTLRHTHGHTRTREPATHHHFRNTAPPLWQQNVPQLPLRPHPHLQPPLTKPTMIPMTIFYSWQVATAQRLTTDAHGPPTDNQTLPPPLSFGAASRHCPCPCPCPGPCPGPCPFPCPCPSVCPFVGDPLPANPFSGPLSCLGFQSFLMLPGSTGQRDCEGKAPEGPSRRSHVTDGWVDVEDHTMAIAFALTHTLAR